MNVEKDGMHYKAFVDETFSRSQMIWNEVHFNRFLFYIQSSQCCHLQAENEIQLGLTLALKVVRIQNENTVGRSFVTRVVIFDGGRGDMSLSIPSRNRSGANVCCARIKLWNNVWHFHDSTLHIDFFSDPLCESAGIKGICYVSPFNLLSRTFANRRISVNQTSRGI